MLAKRRPQEAPQKTVFVLSTRVALPPPASAAATTAAHSITTQPSASLCCRQQAAMQTNQSSVVYDLDAAAFSSDDFRMYQFKVGHNMHPPTPTIIIPPHPTTTHTHRLLAAAGEALPSITAARLDTGTVRAQTDSGSREICCYLIAVLLLLVLDFRFCSSHFLPSCCWVCSVPLHTLEKRPNGAAQSATATQAQRAQSFGGYVVDLRQGRRVARSAVCR